MPRLPGILSFAASLALLSAASGTAQAPYTASPTSALRYAAAHGERALLGGNAVAGLEAWVYPLQILRGLRPGFVQAGAVRAVPGDRILRSIEYEPTSIVRTYVGETFTVRETLFVPTDSAGAVISYKVDSQQPVAVEVSFVPVLDLMWPVGVGGQELSWAPSENAYEMHEPTNRFHAVFGGPAIVQHDDLVNTHVPLESEHRLHVMLRAGSPAQFIIAGSTTSIAEARTTFARLRDHAEPLQSEAVRTQQAWAAHALHIDTPDAEVNNALAWSQWALQQAWVCTPPLGCGLVAGYGPSRGLARRPQYAWYFAGDALDTMPALLSSGDFERTRKALEFLLQFQDKQSGMMWHEMSLSASYVPWIDYPYMFPHVDITFLFLEQLQTYVRMTGDVDFLRAHWPQISRAYDYCKSIIDRGDGLPRVPAGKEGGDEQRRPREELSLAVSWMQAASAFADLATLSGHTDLAPAAQTAYARAATAIPAHFWNSHTKYFASGILSDGSFEPEMHLPPQAAIALLDQTRRADVLARISGREFQTSWGTRGVGSASPTFDPASYATGSVWANGTAATAAILWGAGRNEEAWKVWHALVPWLRLDSMGHLHETLSGSAFEPQIESVPEQTWSSATFVSSFMTGAAGVKVDAPAHTLTFFPRLPTEWDHLNLENVRMGQVNISLRLSRAHLQDKLEFAGNGGGSLLLRFMPAESGGHYAEALLDGRRLKLPPPDQPIEFPVTADGAAHHLIVHYRTGNP